MGMMAKDKLFLFYLSILFLIGIGVQGSRHPPRPQFGLKTLLVFGDSYADTGNTGIAQTRSWHEPYGITFPGKPTGRYSNGRVFTDYLASSLGFASPIPYRWRHIGGEKSKYGMNFAYGGAGVYQTLYPVPNITTQIDYFEKLIGEGWFTKEALDASLAHVSLSGNDYSTYLATGGSLASKDLQSYITGVVNQLVLDVKRLLDLGVKKITVSAIEPVGCAPDILAFLGTDKCNDSLNAAAMFHNGFLETNLSPFNKDPKAPRIAILDFFKAFMSIIQTPVKKGVWSFENPLKPCCQTSGFFTSCGSLDDKGEKLYTLCKTPDKALFWDGVHPTQRAWAAISDVVKPSIHDFLSSRA